jgi:hypothetical protein
LFVVDGQTSSGKTHTLGGASPETGEMSEGVIPFALQDIFERRAELDKIGTKVSIELSYIEIYREECFDLLARDGQRCKLELKETSGGKTVLDGVVCQSVASITEVMAHLSHGAKVRTTGHTAMNAHSSRSHSICTLSLRIERRSSGTGAGTSTSCHPSASSGNVVLSQLHLVDLAGSERAKKTQATGDAFHEGVSINRGLLALGNVVTALVARSNNNITSAAANNNSAAGAAGGGGGDTSAGAGTGGHVHVPYRESKLTRLLKDSLGGNGLTVMLACVSPASCNFEETLNTLRFASRTSSIVNSVSVNLGARAGGSDDTAALMKEIRGLREELALLQAKQSSTGANLSVMNNNRFAPLPSASSIAVQKQPNDSSREEYHFMVLASLRLTTALKALLLVCLEENSFIVDTELIRIQAQLQEIRAGLNLPASAGRNLSSSSAAAGAEGAAEEMEGEDKDKRGQQLRADGPTALAASVDNPFEGLDIDLNAMLALPPIMSLIEDAKLLEKDLKALERVTRVAGGGQNVSGKQHQLLLTQENKGVGVKRTALERDSISTDASGLCADDASLLQNDVSFNESFDGIIKTEHDDNNGADLDMDDINNLMDASFNDADAMCMGADIANFMAMAGGVSSSNNNASNGAGNSKFSYSNFTKAFEQEDLAVRAAVKGLTAKEGEMTKMTALADKVLHMFCCVIFLIFLFYLICMERPFGCMSFFLSFLS